MLIRAVPFEHDWAYIYCLYNPTDFGLRLTDSIMPQDAIRLTEWMNEQGVDSLGNAFLMIPPQLRRADAPPVERLLSLR